MISRAIYESLPFVCITAGMEVIFVLESFWAWPLGILLYGVGAYVWIARANRLARRNDPDYQSPRALGYLYEAAPFIYIFAGVVCLTLFLRYEGEQSLPLTLAASLMFFTAGFGSWILRSVSRRYDRRFHQHHR